MIKAKTRKKISASGMYAGRPMDVFMKALNTIGINENSSPSCEWAMNDPFPGSDYATVTVFTRAGWVNFNFDETGSLIDVDHEDDVS